MFDKLEIGTKVRLDPARVQTTTGKRLAENKEVLEIIEIIEGSSEVDYKFKTESGVYVLTRFGSSRILEVVESELDVLRKTSTKL